MGDFRRDSRGGGDRGGFGGRSRDNDRGGYGGGFGGDRGGRDGGRDSGRNGFSSRRTDLFDAVCAECGKDCRVPFRPTGEKPIYCSECFEHIAPPREDRGDRGARDSRPPRREEFARNDYKSNDFGKNEKSVDNTAATLNQFKEQLGGLSAKLDKILRILTPVVTEVSDYDQAVAKSKAKKALKAVVEKSAVVVAEVAKMEKAPKAEKVTKVAKEKKAVKKVSKKKAAKE